MQRTIERMRRKVGRVNRMLVAGVLVFGFLLGLFSVLFSLNVVTIVDSNGQSRTLITTDRHPEEILELAGVETNVNDEVIFTDNGFNGASIVVNRSFPVMVMVDGEVITTYSQGGTVADALRSSGVELGLDDFPEPSLEADLYRNMSVQVRRVTFEEETARVEVSDSEVESFKQQLQSSGDDKSFVESKSRIYDTTVRNRLIDGVWAGREILSMEAVYHPYDPPSTSFEPGVPVSTIDRFIGIELDANGIPTTYSRKIEGAVCTSYSAGGGRGAGGQGLYCGTVAVDPAKIPYGTRLYITSHDQKFVYGYAIASDCGTAMIEGYVDFDLYFESNAECRRFGKRYLDVYVLD